MSEVGVGFAIACICALPFAFVVAVVVLTLNARNRQLAQIMEERKLMIERGMDLPPLRLPREIRGRRDPLGNLKAGVILLAVAIAVLVPSLLWPQSGLLAGHHIARPAAIAVGILGLGFVGLHFLVRASVPKNGSQETVNGVEEEGH